MARVVVTGMAGLCPIGQSWPAIEASLRQGHSGIRYMPEWEEVDGLVTKLAGQVDFQEPGHWTRKQRRSMGRIAKLAVRATELALEQAGLREDPVLGDGSTGVAYGSSHSNIAAMKEILAITTEKSMRKINGTSYLRMMAHTAAVNIEVFFGLQGRVIPTVSACTSGSQAIGYSYEAIKFGKQQVMLAGGCDELCVHEAGVFDVLYATSQRNDRPTTTPRPFDRDRDGLVVAEGASTLVLEELEHARARGATILAEVVGFATNSDGNHVTSPDPITMRRVMEMALADAELDAGAIGYISAHATATQAGDLAESRATHGLFGSRIPISAPKSYTGHTLGASGSLEAWLAIEMMNRDWYHPTLNLDEVDPECSELDYITGEGRTMSNDHVMTNNFAFGGINTSLIFKRWP